MFGPFSTLLTLPSARVAARYGYAFVEGAGGGPAVFGSGLHNVFDVSVPVKDDLVTFAQWVAVAAREPAAEDGRLRDGQRPVHPAADPGRTEHPAGRRRQDRVLEGVPGRGDRLHADRHADGLDEGRRRRPRLGRRADRVRVRPLLRPAALQPEGVHRHRRPDQGAAFVKAVGAGEHRAAIFVPNGWYGGFQKADSQQMVKAYIAKYGGSPVGHQRRRRRGLLRRPGDGPGGRRDAQPRQREDHQPTCTAA